MQFSQEFDVEPILFGETINEIPLLKALHKCLMVLYSHNKMM